MGPLAPVGWPVHDTTSMCLQVPGHMPLSQLLGPGCFSMQGHNEGILLPFDSNRLTCDALLLTRYPCCSSGKIPTPQRSMSLVRNLSQLCVIPHHLNTTVVTGMSGEGGTQQKDACHTHRQWRMHHLCHMPAGVSCLRRAGA